MVTFETLNELCLKITCTGGNDYVFTKAGAFIGGECQGAKNYKFTKVMLGPEANAGRAVLNQLVRRISGENLPLMRVDFGGDSVTLSRLYRSLLSSPLLFLLLFLLLLFSKYTFPSPYTYQFPPLSQPLYTPVLDLPQHSGIPQTIICIHTATYCNR